MSSVFKIIVSAVLFLQILIHSIHYALDTSNSIVIYSNGKFQLSLKYSDKVPLINNYIEQNGSFRQYVLSYRTIHRLDGGENITSYRESLFVSRYGSRLNIKYELVKSTVSEYVEKYVDYIIEHENSTVRVSNVSIVLNTTNLKQVFILNSTIISTYFLVGGFDFNVEYVEANYTYWVRIRINNIVSNESLLTEPDLRRLLCILQDLDPRIILDNRVESIVARNYLSDSNLVLDRLFLGLDITIFVYKYEYILPVKLPGDYSWNIIIGYSDIVSINSIDWRIVVRNNSVDLTILIEGFGLGSRNNDRILSSIENARRLSREYGCVEAILSDFKIIYRNNTYNSINICPELDTSEITVSAKDLENRQKDSSWNILVLVAIAITLALLLITLFYVIHRVR